MIQDQSGKEQSKTVENQQAEPIVEQINKFLDQNKREQQSYQESTQMKKVELFVPQSIVTSPKFLNEMTEKKVPQLVGQPVRLNMELFKMKPKRTLRDLPIINFGSTDDEEFIPQFGNQRQTIINQQYPQDDRLEYARTIKKMPLREKTFLQAKEDKEQWHQIQVFTEEQTFQNPQHLIVKGQSEADDDNDSEDKEIVHAQDKIGAMNSSVIHRFLQPVGQGYPHSGVKNWHKQFNDWALV